MFCNQCEQTAKGIGCNIAGVCGRDEEVADLQDLLIHALQGLSSLPRKDGRWALSTRPPTFSPTRRSSPP